MILYYLYIVLYRVLRWLSLVLFFYELLPEIQILFRCDFHHLAPLRLSYRLVIALAVPIDVEPLLPDNGAWAKLTKRRHVRICVVVLGLLEDFHPSRNYDKEDQPF